MLNISIPDFNECAASHGAWIGTRILSRRPVVHARSRGWVGSQGIRRRAGPVCSGNIALPYAFIRSVALAA